MMFYKQILYIDTDFIFQRAPDQWFSNMRAYKENNPNKYFFGAVKDWGLENDEYFNAGSFIFEPNCEHYENLMRLVSRKSGNG